MGRYRQRDFRVGEGSNITTRFKPPVLFVYARSRIINFAGPDTAAPGGAECSMESPDSRKKIYEGEWHT